MQRNNERKVIDRTYQNKWQTACSEKLKIHHITKQGIICIERNDDRQHRTKHMTDWMLQTSDGLHKTKGVIDCNQRKTDKLNTTKNGKNALKESVIILSH